MLREPAVVSLGIGLGHTDFAMSLDPFYDMVAARSFSSIWYWMAVVAMWWSASTRILGVPYDMVVRAERLRGQAEQDLDVMARVCCDRIILLSAGAGGICVVALGSALLGGMAVLGFRYGVELAQAAFMIALPTASICLLGAIAARRIRGEESTGEDLRRRMRRHRLHSMMLCMPGVLAASMWGAYRNATFSALGG